MSWDALRTQLATSVKLLPPAAAVGVFVLVAGVLPSHAGTASASMSVTATIENPCLVSGGDETNPDAVIVCGKGKGKGKGKGGDDGGGGKGKGKGTDSTDATTTIQTGEDTTVLTVTW